jgi:biotin transport system permease protein
MISLYVPGNGPLHRCPAGVKLAGFALLALVVSFLPASWWAAAALLALPPLVFAVSGLGWRLLARDARLLGVLLVFLVVTQLIFLEPVQAATNTARVLSLVLLAQAVTRTTPTEGVIGSAERLFGPLRHLGVRPERIGLALALALAAVGQLGLSIRQVREAQRSRGVRVGPWAWVVPVLVLSLKHADDVGDALVARGLD